MRKIATFLASAAALLSIGKGSCSAQSAIPSSVAPLFTSDIIVESNTTANQRNVRVASAFNGWMFAAYIVNDSISNKGGVVVRYSKNGGINWMPFNNYPYFQHSNYQACDITVTGADTNHLSVFVGMVRKDHTTKKFEVEVERYNAMHTAYPSVVVFFQQLDTNGVTDLALANDYKQPAPTDSAYSIGLLYAHHGTSMDSVLFATTEKRLKNKFGKPTLIAAGAHYRKVSIAYLHSMSITGAYCAAWESLDSVKSTYGHILFSRTMSKLDSAWTKPVYLDSLRPATVNKLRSPSISCQYNAVDNDSANATAAVAFDYYNGTDHDILGYYNKKADSANFWNLFVVTNSSNNEIQPNLSFDPTANNFVATYYDSTAKGLTYSNQSMLFSTPIAWNFVTWQYNSNTNLKAPWPRVVMNQLTHKAFFAWVMDPANGNGVVLCNGDYLYTGISEQEVSGLQFLNPYPNPANSGSVLPVSSDIPVTLNISIYNAMGQLVNCSSEHFGGGVKLIDLNTSSFAPGIYVCRIATSDHAVTRRLIVEH